MFDTTQVNMSLLNLSSVLQKLVDSSFIRAAVLKGGEFIGAVADSNAPDIKALRTLSKYVIIEMKS